MGSLSVTCLHLRKKNRAAAGDCPERSPYGPLVRRIDGLSSGVLDMAINPDGSTIAAGETAGPVELFLAAGGRKLWAVTAALSRGQKLSSPLCSNQR